MIIRSLQLLSALLLPTPDAGVQHMGGEPLQFVLWARKIRLAGIMKIQPDFFVHQFDTVTGAVDYFSVDAIVLIDPHSRPQHHRNGAVHENEPSQQFLLDGSNAERTVQDTSPLKNSLPVPGQR
jgi:hypothetical protein